MTKILLLILLINTSLFAQTKVEAENYIRGRSSGILTAVIDSGILATDKGYADYDIVIPKNGWYIFKMNVANKDNQNAAVSIKLPTSKTVLASVPIPFGDWKDISVRVKLAKATKKIRFVFSGSSELNTFTYSLEGTETSEYVLKSEHLKLKNTLDSMINLYRKNVWVLDKNKFKLLNDSTISIID